MSYNQGVKGRGGACWSCPKGSGKLKTVFCPSGLEDFVGDDKNHRLCPNCIKALEEAKASGKPAQVHPTFQAKLNSLLSY